MRVCGETKNLIDGFYKTRKSKSHLSPHTLMSVRNVPQRDRLRTEKRRRLTISGFTLTGKVILTASLPKYFHKF